MPDAQNAALADLVALAAVAEPTNPVVQAGLAAQPETPTDAAMTVAQASLQAGMAVASSVETLNPMGHDHVGGRHPGGGHHPSGGERDRGSGGAAV